MEQREARASILVVDDEQGPRESLRMILEPIHSVLQASSGAEALETLRTHPVDLVTLDLNMPGMKGQDLMRTVRQELPQVEIIVITGCGSVESAAEGIRFGICDYLQKPFDVVQVGSAVTRALTRRRSRLRLTSFLEELGQAVGRERDAAAILDDVHRSHKLRGRLAGLFEPGGPDTGPIDPNRTVEFLEVLAETIEIQDAFMRGHARRVAFYASLLAERLNLSASDHEQVRVAAFLHDLGKVGLPTQVLLRPGALDSPERSLVERHPVIGARLVKSLNLPSSVPLAIRHHHEWWDGSGYPDGLAGEEIPLIARIISVADAFDAMTCERPYRPALARSVVLSELRRYAGVQFDAELAKEFVTVLETGVCDVDPMLVADAVVAARAGTPSPAAG
jgi:putative nucleotidyltransferase with HDIG domain